MFRSVSTGVVLMLCALGAIAGPSGAAAGVVLRQGPLLGALTATSAHIWARWSAGATTEISYRPVGASTFTSVPGSRAASSSDFTSKLLLTGLAPDTTYEYRLISTSSANKRWNSASYFIKTAAAQPEQLSFTVLGDFAAGLKASPSLTAATQPRPDFLVILGDWDHRDPARQPDSKLLYPISDAPLVLANMRGMHRDTRTAGKPIGNDIINGVIASNAPGNPQVPLYYAWDDHDYCANNEDAACPFKAQALQAYDEYFAMSADNGITATSCEAKGDWQAFTHGNLASFFILDARSNREAIAPGASMLGACQKNWLLDGLLNSTARWKVVLSPVPFHPQTKPWDGWAAYPEERREIVDFITVHGIHNVMFVSADIHSGGAIDDGTNADFPEVSVPHANMPSTSSDTYCTQPGGVIACSPGTWTMGSTTPIPGTFAAPPYPIDGRLGPGFVKVVLSQHAARLDVLDASGAVKQGARVDGVPVPMSLTIDAWAPTSIVGIPAHSTPR